MIQARVDHKGHLGRRGFTLAEIIVVLIVLATLAAVVIPAIAHQAQKADPNQAANDVVNLRGAIEQFVGDVRKYPNSIGQLTSKISTSVHPLTTTTNYGAADVARWKGPYLTTDSLGARATGYGASFKFAFDTCTLTNTGTTSTANGIKYLILSLPGPLDTLSWVAIDETIDDGAKSTGAVRWSGTGAATDTLKVLLIPIQP